MDTREPVGIFNGKGKAQRIAGGTSGPQWTVWGKLMCGGMRTSSAFGQGRR